MRTRIKTDFIDLYHWPSQTSVPVRHAVGFSKMIDVNNGKSRPESPCDMVKARMFPPEAPPMMINGDRRHTTLIEASFYADTFRSEVLTKVGEHEKSLVNRVESKKLALTKRFSSINFFAELTDVSTLIKSLDRFRYVDYQFGISPVIDDIKNISNGLTTSISSINARLAAYKKPTPISESFNSTYLVQLPKGFTNESSGIVSGFITIKSRFKGLFDVELPLLSRYNQDYMLWLDNIGFHPDLSTVYEATPFSWLIDWFLPIGPYLESFNKSWLNPTINFTGSISSTYTFSGSLVSDDFGSVFTDPKHHLPHQTIQEFEGSGYIRTPVSQKILGSGMPRVLKLGLGLDSLSKIALLSDIFGPTSAPKKNSSSRDRFVRAYDKLSHPFQRGQQVKLRNS